MILCKVLNECSHEVPAILASKIGVKYAGKELQAMAVVAKAAKARSLQDFKQAVSCAGHHSAIYLNSMIRRHWKMKSILSTMI
jgi:hypothetical protein